jgi:hypothetical protein
MAELREVWMPSPHYSTSRGPYNKVVFHTTEGAMKIRDLGAWFANPSAQCSSHHGADNYERGVFGAYVYENCKAWTQGNANDWCLSIELCAYASWSRDTWLGSKAVLVDNAAEWLAYMVAKYDVPWTLLSNAQAQDPDVRGICQHVNFGSWGSGHHDCGSGFPLDVVVDKAKKWGGSSGGNAADMAVAVAYWNDKPYYAGVWADGKVNFREPGGSWFAVDPGQSGAKSGCGLGISDDGEVVITYTNANGAACTYRRGAGASGFTWGSISPDNSFR